MIRNVQTLSGSTLVMLLKLPPELDTICMYASYLMVQCITNTFARCHPLPYDRLLISHGVFQTGGILQKAYFNLHLYH